MIFNKLKILDTKWNICRIDGQCENISAQVIWVTHLKESETLFEKMNLIIILIILKISNIDKCVDYFTWHNQSALWTVWK